MLYNCERNFFKTWVEITPEVVKSFFKLGYKQFGVQTQIIPKTTSTIYIYRKGKEREAPFVSYNAFQITDEGFVGFYWDSTFLNADPGYYVGDVYYCGEYCWSVNFYIPRCRTRAQETYNEVEAACAPSCGADSIGGSECSEISECPPPDTFNSGNTMPEPVSCDNPVSPC